MAQVGDPYRALGVARGASTAEIKAAHRRLAKRYHPDAAAGEARRFLLVQEAYRILSDPLLRREWDAAHAPGPVRAAPASPPPRSQRPGAEPRRRSARPAEPARATDDARSEPPAAARAKPRSARAYTWSAAEVPWWEEGIKRDPKRAARRKPAGREPPAHPQAEPEPERPPVGADFEVYNRSSGAAWSMAARAYFRRGDQDLPRRGSFHHQGGQPLTAGRARAVAAAEARQRAAGDPRAAADDGGGDGVFGRLKRKLGGDGR